MKRMCCCMTAMLLLAAVVTMPLSAHAAWELYDDFSSKSINTTKWSKDNSSANISIVNGQLQFKHLLGHANDSSWLWMKNAAGIKGIRAKIKVASYTDDLRVRITGDWANVVGADEFAAIQIGTQPSNSAWFSRISVLNDTSNAWLYELFSSNFKYPVKIVGKTYTVTMTFPNPKKVTYTVTGLGTITFALPANPALEPRPNEGYGLGTISYSGNGSGVVYFDDVEVLR